MTGTSQNMASNDGAPIRALLLDDDAIDRMRIKRFMEKSDVAMDVHEVPSLSDMQAALSDGDYDLIMLDYHLADGSGLDALDMIHETAHSKDAAVIMVSGQEQASVAVSAFRNGCNDFLAKNELTRENVQTAVSNALRARETRMYFNPAGSPDFRKAVLEVMTSAIRSPDVQAAMMQSIREANVKAGNAPAHQDHLNSYVVDFLEDQDFQFNS